MEKLESIIVGDDGYRLLKDRYEAIGNILDENSQLDLPTYDKLANFLQKSASKYKQDVKNQTEYQQEAKNLYDNLQAKFNSVQVEEQPDSGLQEILDGKGSYHFWNKRIDSIRDYVDNHEPSGQVLEYINQYIDRKTKRNKPETVDKLKELKSYIQDKGQKQTTASSEDMGEDFWNKTVDAILTEDNYIEGNHISYDNPSARAPTENMDDDPFIRKMEREIEEEASNFREIGDPEGFSAKTYNPVDNAFRIPDYKEVYSPIERFGHLLDASRSKRVMALQEIQDCGLSKNELKHNYPYFLNPNLNRLSAYVPPPDKLGLFAPKKENLMPPDIISNLKSATGKLLSYEGVRKTKKRIMESGQLLMDNMRNKMRLYHKLFFPKHYHKKLASKGR